MKNTILNPAHILGKICCPLPIILVHSKLNEKKSMLMLLLYMRFPTSKSFSRLGKKEKPYLKYLQNAKIELAGPKRVGGELKQVRCQWTVSSRRSIITPLHICHTNRFNRNKVRTFINDKVHNQTLCIYDVAKMLLYKERYVKSI